jgi:hypothetical protein
MQAFPDRRRARRKRGVRGEALQTPLGWGPGRVYITAMEHFLPVLIVLAMLATLGVLGLGLLNMARGNSARRSNKLMQSRVLLQGIALLLFIVFMWLFRR